MISDRERSAAHYIRHNRRILARRREQYRTDPRIKARILRWARLGRMADRWLAAR